MIEISLEKLPDATRDASSLIGAASNTSLTNCSFLSLIRSSFYEISSAAQITSPDKRSLHGIRELLHQVSYPTMGYRRRGQ